VKYTVGELTAQTKADFNAGAVVINATETSQATPFGTEVLVRIEDDGTPVFWNVESEMHARAEDLVEALLDVPELWAAGWDLISVEYDYSGLTGNITMITRWRMVVHKLDPADQFGPMVSYAMPVLIPLAILAVALMGTAAIIGVTIEPDGFRKVAATVALTVHPESEVLQKIAVEPIKPGQLEKLINTTFFVAAGYLALSAYRVSKG